MNLKSYLEQPGKTQAEFAANIGVSQSLVSQWVTGKKRVRAEVVQIIEVETKSQVTRQDLRPDIFGSPPSEAAA